jgi:hypothetical protein
LSEWPAGEVRVWRANLLEWLERSLSPRDLVSLSADERARADRILIEDARRRFLISRILARRILAECTNKILRKSNSIPAPRASLTCAAMIRFISTSRILIVGGSLQYRAIAMSASTWKTLSAGSMSSELPRDSLLRKKLQ